MPVRWGFALGTIAGAGAAVRAAVIEHSFQHHLYKAASRAFALDMDCAAAVGVAAICVIWAGAQAERRLKPRVRRTLNVVLVVLAAAAVAIWAGAVEAARGIFLLGSDRYFFTAMRNAIPWNALLVAGCVLLWALVMRSMGAKGDKGKDVLSSLWRGFRRLAANDRVLAAFPIALLIANAAATALAARAASDVRGRPNVVFIAVCSLRADHLGCYGYRWRTSPAIDRLAQDGTRYEHAVAQASWTRPSVASFLSSQHPLSFGGDFARVDDGFVLMAEALREHGYATAGVTSNFNAGTSVNISQGFDRFTEAGPEQDITSPAVTDEALKLIRGFRDKPFFLFLLYADPHSPYTAHRDYEARPIPAAFAGGQFDAKSLAIAEPEAIEPVVAVYDSEILFTDTHIGMVLEDLRRRGLYDSSLIIFAADHGEGFGDHGLFEHGNSLYEELIRVPLIVKLPGQKQTNVVKESVALMDLFPSTMRLLGYDTRAYGLAGCSLDLRAAQQPPDRCFFSSADFGAEMVSMRCVRAAGYKYIVDMRKLTQELYHVAEDPGEKVNIIKDQPALAGDLRQALQEFVAQMESSEGAVGGPTAAEVFTPQELERLRSLGYVR